MSILIPAPYQYLTGAVLIIAAYAAGRYDGNTISEGVAAREERVAQVAQEAASKATAGEIAKMEIKNVTIRQTLQREVIREPVYRDCKHTDIGMQLVNEALTGRTVSPGDRKLP